MGIYFDEPFLGKADVDSSNGEDLSIFLVFRAVASIDGSLGAGCDQRDEFAELDAEFLDFIVFDLDEPVGFNFLGETKTGCVRWEIRATLDIGDCLQNIALDIFQVYGSCSSHDGICEWLGWFVSLSFGD